MAAMASVIARGDEASGWGTASMCSVRPRLPAAAFRMRIARLAAVAPWWCPASPGPSASADPCAKRSASPSSAAVSIPASSAAASRVYRETMSEYGPASPPRRTSSPASASAMCVSEPARAGIHSSAFCPVSDRRGPTKTKVPFSPWSTPCISAKSAAKRTGEIQVSRKSAPNETRKSDAARS